MLDLAGGVLGAVCLAAGYLLDVSALGRVAGWLCLGFLIVSRRCCPFGYSMAGVRGPRDLPAADLFP